MEDDLLEARLVLGKQGFVGSRMTEGLLQGSVVQGGLVLGVLLSQLVGLVVVHQRG